VHVASLFQIVRIIVNCFFGEVGGEGTFKNEIFDLHIKICQKHGGARSQKLLQRYHFSEKNAVSFGQLRYHFFGHLS
jgi:hypothetical protein